MKTSLIALTLTAISAWAMSANAQNISAAAPDVQDYTYGTQLDIAKVTTSPDLNFCGVRPVLMSYIDHAGKPHTLRYEASGDGCLGQN